MAKTPFNLVLYQPVIPQNTGSIARLCACTGAALHLIHPLGFQIDAASVKRAGLDYWDHVEIYSHANWSAFLKTEAPTHEQLFFLTKFSHADFFHPGTLSEKSPSPIYLVLGSETSGLPTFIHETFTGRCFQVPMRTHLVRSLNLAQCAAVVLYEAMRRIDGFSNLNSLEKRDATVGPEDVMLNAKSFPNNADNVPATRPYDS